MLQSAVQWKTNYRPRPTVYKVLSEEKNKTAWWTESWGANQTFTGIIAHALRLDWWLELEGVAERSGRTLAVVLGGSK